MPSVLTAVLLIASLLLVHFSVRRQPLPKTRPLNVDTGLPLPEAGQASTVFSLTALFGAYYGIYLLLGMPALAGLALGTISALLFIRKWITASPPRTFESFLSRVFKDGHGNSALLAFVISGLQCAYATSELLILREVAILTLGVRSDHATLLAIGAGLIGYFYVLFGGYMALFRTDVLQFVMVTAMALAFSAALISRGVPLGSAATLLPRPGYWELPFVGPPPLLYAYHFILGTVMGAGFLTASPDAWKRVFQITRTARTSRLRFLTLVCVGTAPFLVLLPLASAVPRVPDGPVTVNQMFSGLLTNDILFVTAALGLIGSFLSSFNSALLVSVHVGLILRRKKRRVASEQARFHWLMVTALLTVFSLFAGLLSFQNPYLLANLLLGPFALIAGVLIGAGGAVTRLPNGTLLWIVVVGLLCWLMYFVHVVGLPRVPTTYQVNTVPGGVLLFCATAVCCRVLGTRGPTNVRS